MRINRLIWGMAALLCSLSSLALADEGSFDDSRRPKLKMSTREDVPYDLGNTGKFDGEVGMKLGDSTWEEFYFQHLELGGLLGRFRTILTDPAYYGQHEEAQQIARYLESSGIFNYRSAETTYSITGDSIHYSAISSFGELDPASYIGRYYAIADEAPKSSQYVSRGQYLMYLTLPNFYETTMLQLEHAVEQQKQLGEEAAGPLSELFGQTDLSRLEDMLAIMKVMGVDKIIGDSLTGELALVIYELENIGGYPSGNVAPSDFDVALMFGLKDMTYVSKMADTYGPELGLSPAVDQGGWKVLSMANEPSIGLFYNDDVLVVTPDLTEVMANVSSVGENALNAPPCQVMLDVNLARIDGELLGPLSGMLMDSQQTDPDFSAYLRSVGYLVSKPDPATLGSLTITASHAGGNSQQASLDFTKSALRYGAYHLLAGFGALAHNEEWLEELGIGEMLEDLPEMIEEHQQSSAAE